MKRSPLLLLLLLVATPLVAQHSTFTGRLVGHDGRPMRLAHVHLLGADGRSTIATAQAGPDGSYRLEGDATGLVTLQFTGVDHRNHTARMFIDSPREIATDVRLSTYHFPKQFDNVKVIGEFNDFDFDDARPLVKGKNGTYTASIKSGGKKMAYQLVFQRPDGSGVWSMNGTDAIEFQYDGAGDYRSYVPVKKGRATLVFDPSKLTDGPEEPMVEYKDATVAALAKIMENVEEREAKSIEAIRARIREGKDLSDWSYDWTSEMKRLNDAIAAEKSPQVRAALLLSYIQLRSQGAMNLDSTVAERALREIPANSPLWSMYPEALYEATEITGHGADYESYRWSAIETNPDENIGLKTLYAAVQGISYEKEPERFNRYYNYLEEHHGETFEARYAKAEYSPDRSIQIGRSVPAFSLASIENPSVTITNQSMGGKLYLIDFWATWCGPCVSEMANLHAAYEKHHAKGFEILSLSFDRSPEAVARFRNGTWKMPWMHAFIEGGFDSDMASRFEVLGIPKPVLVDANGKIVAVGNELRGSGLMRTLDRLLSDVSMAR